MPVARAEVATDSKRFSPSQEQPPTDRPMLTPIPLTFPRRRRHRPKTRTTEVSPPPVTGPVLVSASWDVGTLLLTLTFDRAVNATGLQPDTVVVFDGSAVTEYRNNGDVGQPTPESAEILVAEFGEFTGSGVAMTATEPTGIVAIDGGTQWGGVTNLALPFP